MKKLLAVLLAVCMVASFAGFAFAADEIQKTGTFGKGYSYYFNDVTGTLVLRGIGSLDELDALGEDVPWATFKDQIKRIIIDTGTIQILMGLFNDLPNLESLVLPAGVEAIDPDAFAGCAKLGTVEVIGTAEDAAAMQQKFKDEGISVLSDAAVKAVSPEAVKAEIDDVIDAANGKNDIPWRAPPRAREAGLARAKPLVATATAFQAPSR